MEQYNKNLLECGGGWNVKCINVRVFTSIHLDHQRNDQHNEREQTAASGEGKAEYSTLMRQTRRKSKCVEPKVRQIQVGRGICVLFERGE